MENAESVAWIMTINPDVDIGVAMLTVRWLWDNKFACLLNHRYSARF